MAASSYSSKSLSPSLGNLGPSLVNGSHLPKRKGNGVAFVKAQEKCKSDCVRVCVSRREVGLTASVLLVGVGVVVSVGVGVGGALEMEEYEKETRQVISQVRGTIEMDKADPNTSTAVAALREASNNWVAKYRRDKQLAGKPSFSNMYSVLNAISGHYISFGPTAPIPIKRKARILEEVESAEKALSKGR